MKALIFDFDGTLADSFPLAVDIFHEVTDNDYPLSSQKMQGIGGQSTVEVVKRMDIPWWRVPFVVASSRKLMHERMEGVQPFPAIGPVLHQLCQRGYHLFVVSTNTEKNINLMLDDHDLRQFFDVVYGNVSLFGKAKVLREIMGTNHIKPADCAYIGDEERDMLAAQQAGIRSVAVGWGYNIEQVLAGTKPSFFAHTPADLLRIFGSDQV